MTTPRIEEMVEEFQQVCPHTSPHCEKERCFGSCNQDIYVDWLRTALTQAHQAWIDEAVEIVKSVRIEGRNRHADDKTEDQRDYLNDWILPEIKKNIIKALQDKK